LSAVYSVCSSFSDMLWFNNLWSRTNIQLWWCFFLQIVRNIFFLKDLEKTSNILLLRGIFLKQNFDYV
jgi:hypothetical protein